MRIPPGTDATTATIDQVRRLVGLLDNHREVPMFVFDAGYDPIALGAGLDDVRAQALVLPRGNRSRMVHATSGSAA
jgi:hypothetical protein